MAQEIKEFYIICLAILSLYYIDQKVYFLVNPEGHCMPQNKLYKTVHQYNKEPVPHEDMAKLQEIAVDYCRVKNYVYGRYGGIRSLSKLYPGYTVQNEMTDCGLRTELGMPSVYFYRAVFDALGDIKCQWTKTKSSVMKAVGRNENLTVDEKHYLRFLLKVNSAFEGVLNQNTVQLPQEIQKQYDELSGQVDVRKLHRYLCRQVRKHHHKQHTEVADGFGITERAYRYADHGIYISTKQSRKRVFIPLTDNNQYSSQLYIKLFPEHSDIEVIASVNVKVHVHDDYTNQIGLAAGMYTMFTTHEGHRYGEDLGKYQIEYAEWVRRQMSSYQRNRGENPGRKKYYAKKGRLEEKLHSYVNHELNRFIQTEKPGIIYIAKLPKQHGGGFNKKINYSVNMWQRGYIRKRLVQKCKEQSVEVVEVLGNNISRECSRCGAAGSSKEGIFFCESCGCRMEEKVNTASNVLKRGIDGKVVY